MTTIVFAGGGSGGHLFPGVAVAEEIAQREPTFRMVFVGSNRSLEKQILDARELPHIPLGTPSSSAIFRSPLTSALQQWKAYRSSLAILTSLRPDVVIGLGGFASVPTVVAAWKRRIPILLLEQNAVLGRANRLLLPLCQTICLSFPDTPMPGRYRSKAKVTGNPIRKVFHSSAPWAYHEGSEPPVLLIMGGSQGATVVNEALLKALPQMSDELAGWKIVHQTGVQHECYVRKEYDRLGLPVEVASFLNDIQLTYRKSRFVIARAGATSLAEFATCGLPAILIPYPNSIRDHQKRNAEFYAEKGGAVLIEQSSQLVDRLTHNLRFLLTDAHRCEIMGKSMSALAQPHAAKEVVEHILTLRHIRRENGKKANNSKRFKTYETSS